MKKLLLLLLFILIPLSLALDFNIYFKQLIDTCDCNQYIHEITINNQDKADFLIYSKELNWISPFQFSLDKNEIRQVKVPINIPCRIQGQYALNLYIKTPTLIKNIPLTINVKRCPNIEVNTVNYQEACPGQQIKFPIEIKNTGNFKETYSFDLDKYKQYSLIDYKALAIDPGKSAKFNLYLNIPLTFEDEYNFTFITKTKYSKLTASTSLSFKASPCYKYSLDYDNNYTLCQDTEEEIKINVKNQGSYKELIAFSLDAPKWISLDKNELELEKNKENNLNIKVNPDKIGKYNLKLISKLNYKKTDDIKLNVFSKRDCYKAEITSNPIKLNQQGSFKIKNIGLKEAAYSLSINSDWIKIPDSITLKPNEEKEINLDINWTGKEGRYDFNIKAVKDDQEFVQSVTIGEFVFHKKIWDFFVKIYNKVKDLTIKNIRYVAIVIGAIILLIIILKVISKVGEKKLEKELLKEEEPEKIEKPKKAKIEVKAEKIEKEEKPKEKPKKKEKQKQKTEFKFPWKIVIPIFVIILLFLLFYFVKTLKNYLLSYWLYLLIGIVVLFLLIFFINLISKVEIKKREKTIKWLITILVIILILAFVYLQFPNLKFNLNFNNALNKTLDKTKSFFIGIWDYIKPIAMPIYDFLYVYINYIILGFVILIILIFFISVLGKKKGEEKEVKEVKKNSKRKK